MKKIKGYMMMYFITFLALIIVVNGSPFKNNDEFLKKALEDIKVQEQFIFKYEASVATGDLIFGDVSIRGESRFDFVKGTQLGDFVLMNGVGNYSLIEGTYVIREGNVIVNLPKISQEPFTFQYEHAIEDTRKGLGWEDVLELLSEAHYVRKRSREITYKNNKIKEWVHEYAQEYNLAEILQEVNLSETLQLEEEVFLNDVLELTMKVSLFIDEKNKLRSIVIVVMDGTRETSIIDMDIEVLYSIK